MLAHKPLCMLPVRLVFNLNLYQFKKKKKGSQDSLLAERQTHDRKVTGLSPGGAAGECSFPELTVCADLCLMSVPPCVIAVARKRPPPLCQKHRWQVTPKHACTHDPMKSEWDDYAVQA